MNYCVTRAHSLWYTGICTRECSGRWKRSEKASSRCSRRRSCDCSSRKNARPCSAGTRKPAASGTSKRSPIAVGRITATRPTREPYASCTRSWRSTPARSKDSSCSLSLDPRGYLLVVSLALFGSFDFQVNGFGATRQVIGSRLVALLRGVFLQFEYKYVMITRVELMLWIKFF